MKKLFLDVNEYEIGITRWNRIQITHTGCDSLAVTFPSDSILAVTLGELIQEAERHHKENHGCLCLGLNHREDCPEYEIPY